MATYKIFHETMRLFDGRKMIKDFPPPWDMEKVYACCHRESKKRKKELILVHSTTFATPSKK